MDLFFIPNFLKKQGIYKILQSLKVFTIHDKIGLIESESKSTIMRKSYGATNDTVTIYDVAQMA